MKFTSTDYGNKKEILKLIDHYVAIPVTVDGTAGQTMSAGTVIGGIGGSALADENLHVEEKNTQGASSGTAGAGVDAEGILFNDVEFDENGEGNGTMLVHGFVDTSKLPSTPVADAIDALKLIQFID